MTIIDTTLEDSGHPLEPKVVTKPKGRSLSRTNPHKNIATKLARLGALAAELRGDIIKAYPPGTRVGVLLSSVQQVPTPATVRASHVEISTWSDHAWGYVIVKIDTAKPRSRLHSRLVSLDMVRRLA